MDEALAKILVVDDTEAGRYSTRRVLQSAGFEVFEASGGLEALEKARELPDLIVLDVQMPDMSGFEVCKRLKSDPATGDIPVLHLTATYLNLKDKVLGLDGGADGYLTHPVEQVDLVVTINALLRTKSAEQLAEKTARQWHTTFDAITDAICLLGTDGRILRANRAFSVIAGEDSELAGRFCYEVMHGTTTFIDNCPFVRSVESRKRESMEAEIPGRFFEVTTDPVFNQHGEICSLVHIMRDITAEKAAVVKIRESEERYRSIFDNNHAVMLLVDPDNGAIVDANPAAANYYGYDHEALCGMNICNINPLSFDEIKAAMKRARQGGHTHFDFQHRLANGELRNVEVYSGAIAVAGKELLFSIVHDVTSRWESEKKLRESEELFRSIFDNALDGIFMLHAATGRFVIGNAVFCRMIGYSKEELQHLSINDIHPPEAIPLVLETIQQKVAGTLRLAENIPVQRKDGTIVHADIDSAPMIRDDDTFLVAITRDVSERKHAEAEKAKLEEQLRHSQKMESIGTLAGGVAHDFNNILTAIVGYGDLALLKMNPDDPCRYNVVQIRAAADRAAHLTKDLLLFSRKQASERKPVNINSCIGKMENFLKRILRENISYRTNLLQTDLPILADSYQIDQVIMNLAINAQDAMPDNGAFTIATNKIELDERFFEAYGYGKPGWYARLDISDTGIGMDEITQKKIFEPFFTTKEVGKGTGLGLAVVYGIVKQHDGFINVYCEPGKGTTFHVYLPLIVEGEECSAGLVERQAPQGGNETILLAEDNDMVRDVTTIILESAGYTVIAAVDGVDAMAKFEEHADTVELLLFDLIMPKMNGKEAYDEIIKVRPEIKVIFASGYAPGAVRSEMTQGGAMPILFKPAPPDELLRSVRKVLDGGKLDHE